MGGFGNYGFEMYLVLSLGKIQLSFKTRDDFNPGNSVGTCAGGRRLVI